MRKTAIFDSKTFLMRTVIAISCLLLAAGCGSNSSSAEKEAPEKTAGTTTAPAPAPAADTQQAAPAPAPATTAAWAGVQEINDAAFKEKVLANPGVTIVDFNAEWCGPCKRLKPIFNQASKDFAGKASFASVDVDQNPGVSRQYNIQSIPLLLFFKNGKMVHSITGLPEKSDFYAAVKKVL